MIREDRTGGGQLETLRPGLEQWDAEFGLQFVDRHAHGLWRPPDGLPGLLQRLFVGRRQQHAELHQFHWSTVSTAFTPVSTIESRSLFRNGNLMCGAMPCNACKNWLPRAEF